MNLEKLIEYNRFKEAMARKEIENAKSQVLDFAGIKTAESMDVSELLKIGQNIILIGVIDKNFSSRPIVYNTHEGSEYPKHEAIAFFPQIDLRQNLIELQDIIEVVPDPEFDLAMIERPSDEMELVNIEQVYGKAKNKNGQLVAHLTLAEVLSQLAHYRTRGKYFFYVCDAAEDCDELTSIAGYHAYRVAIFMPRYASDGIEHDLTADGISADDLI